MRPQWRLWALALLPLVLSKSSGAAWEALDMEKPWTSDNSKQIPMRGGSSMDTGACPQEDLSTGGPFAEMEGLPPFLDEANLDQLLLDLEHDRLNATYATTPSLDALLQALSVMQNSYFEVWRGTWPTAIDWTAAVMNTQISGALSALTQSPSYVSHDSPFGAVSDNTLSGYFAHVSSFYFGENAFALRMQAYDDMLWVVLGWLEAVRFVRMHSSSHYLNRNSSDGPSSTWHGRHFIPAFAHRSRIFWDLAHKGWDTQFCNGGMVWSPYLGPYKNAITNQLYIAASASMYLYFPGDSNGFPFSQAHEKRVPGECPLPSIEPHDPQYLEAAEVAYDWLMNSGMLNLQGLFVDGFHVSGWEPGNDRSNGTLKCDKRNDMVYTYNQGVILTGQRSLWRATGNISYLNDGHALVQNVIKATGWQDDGYHFPGWCGIGRRGILEERCDSLGHCDQNGQTFKGIFFHHLAEFCTDLEQDDQGWSATLSSNRKVFYPATPEQAAAHARQCAGYAPWLARNARAALGTRNGAGKFGQWWTLGLFASPDDANIDAPLSLMEPPPDEPDSEDYRNYGIPLDRTWQLIAHPPQILPGAGRQKDGIPSSKDANDRGRGRTVETQSGGIAILKALYALVERRREASA